VFGYRNLNVHKGTDKDGRPLRSHVVPEVHEDEAAVVRDVFALAARGDSFMPVSVTPSAGARCAPTT
jgi:hypothetical protein